MNKNEEEFLDLLGVLIARSRSRAGVVADQATHLAPDNITDALHAKGEDPQKLKEPTTAASGRHATVERVRRIAGRPR